VLRRIPECVRREDDVGRGEERGRVAAPDVGDDGAVGARAGQVARRVLAERADQLCVGKVAGDHAYVWVALGDEDAR